MVIDKSLMYLVLSVIAAIILTYISIKYSSKNRTKVSLLYFENRCLSLFKSVVKNLDELEIVYKGKTVTENLINYQGTFINSGNSDIDKNLVHSPVKIILPKDYEWKKVVIIDESDGVKIDYETSSNELQFTWDILKEKEFFTFDSIIEYMPEPDLIEIDSQKAISNITEYLSEEITFSHRISNLKEIGYEEIPDKPMNIIGVIVFGILLLGFGVLGFFGTIGQFTSPDYKLTHEIVKDSTSSFVSIILKDKERIFLTDSIGEIRVLKCINCPNQPYLTGAIKIKQIKLNYLTVTGTVLLTLLMLCLFIMLVREQYRSKRKYKWFKQVLDKE